MEINTQFGQQTIDPEDVIHFPEGLIGFESTKKFKLFHEEGKPTVFWLQSLDDPELQFSVADPARLNVAFEVKLNDPEQALLQIDGSEEIGVLVTVAEHDDSANASVRPNLLAPLILNISKRLGLQKSLNKVQHSVIIKAE